MTDKIMQKLKELPKKLLVLWNKYTGKQKTIMISIVAGVVLVLGILIWYLQRMVPVELFTFQTTKSASEAISLLKSSDIKTKLGDDNLTVYVDEDDYQSAIMLISTSDSLTSSGFGINDLLNTSISTTNGERLIRNHLYLQSELRKAINQIKGVKDCTINYIPKDSSTSILSSNKETPASVFLVTNSQFDKSSAETIATYVAYALGNETTKNIKIMDNDGNLLYDGPEEKTDFSINDKAAYEKYVKDAYKKSIDSVLLRNGYTEVSIALDNLKINFDAVKETITKYTPADDQEQGLMGEYHKTESENTNTGGDVVGTDGNDDTDYYISDSGSGSSSSETEDIYYLPNVQVKDIVYDTGVVNAEDSSIAITLTKAVTRTEEELQLLGLLDDMTFDEYRLANSDPIRQNVPQAIVELVSMATGIDTKNIAITAYTVYTFVPKVVEPINWSLYLEILLAVLILGLLVYVVFRGMATEEIVEFEPELSVEQLLATTKENQSLEDVEFSEKSEIRKLIEKFFDENPESVAQLLRNWLNDEWN